MPGLKLPLAACSVTLSFIATISLITSSYDDSQYNDSSFFSNAVVLAVESKNAPRARNRAPTEDEFLAQLRFESSDIGLKASAAAADMDTFDATRKQVFDDYQMLPSWNQRMQTHIQTDKVVYRPNDVMFIEVFTFDAFSKKPLDAEAWAWNTITVEILDGTDNIVHSESTSEMSYSTFAVSYKVPEDAPGGEYLIRTAGYNFPCSNKIVRVRDYDRQQLVVQTEFDRDTYYPGETVTGTIIVTPADGNPFRSPPTINYDIYFGDEAIPVEVKGAKLNVKTNSYAFSFKVPERTDLQYPTMSIIIDTGSIRQPATKVLTVGQPNKLYVEFFPETNFVTIGVQNKIYFQAWANEQMSDIVDFGNANLIDEDGEMVQSNIGTFHRGKGAFTFVPQKDKKYFLDINLGGSRGRVQRVLPEIDLWMQSNVSFQLSKNVLDNDETLSVVFRPNKEVSEESTYQFAIQQKEQVLFSYELEFTPGQETKFDIKAKAFPLLSGGVLTASLTNLDNYIIYNDELERSDEERGYISVPEFGLWIEPAGEILFFKKPSETLELSISTDQDTYAPGDEVSFTVSVKNDGKTVDKDAYVSVTVTDESVFAQLSQRQQPPHLAAQVLLEHEIFKTNYEWDYNSHYVNHIYGVNGEDSADANIELLLGVQSWRYCAFCPVALMERKQTLDDMEDEEKERFSSLYATAGAEEDVMFEMEAMAFDDAGPMPMARAGGAANNEVMRKSNTEESENSSESSRNAQTESLDEEAPKRDFMTNIKANTRWFSHSKRDDWSADDRVDMTETVFFAATQPVKGGKIQGTFELSDLITQFRVTANVFDSQGALGYNSLSFQAVKPFYVHFELPSNFLVGDIINSDISLTNNYNKDLEFAMSVDSNFNVLSSVWTKQLIQVPKKSQKTVSLSIEALAPASEVFWRVKFTSEEGISDQLTQFTSVKSEGFPQQKSGGGFISSQNHQSETPDHFDLNLKLPETYVPGSLSLEAKVLSTSFAQLLEAVEALVRDPYGCFEQTSSTTYPVVMAYNMLCAMEEDEKVSDLKARLEEKMSKGYKRLVTFETPDEGYEWFGSSPPHEALSAYGLQEFVDMAANSQLVDPVMVARLQEWLLNRRDGEGSFQLNDRALDSFGRAPQTTTDAYILWSLTHAGVKEGLDREIAALKKDVDIGDSSKDPYIIGLLSIILSNVGREDEATTYAKMLPSFLQNEGEEEEIYFIDGAQTSVTSSQGRYLKIEATSIAILAWMPFQSQFSTELEQTIKTLVSCVKNGGGYGGTQSTVLAIKAITSYMQNYAAINGSGKFVLYANDEPLQTLSFSEEEKEALKFNDVEDILRELDFKPEDEVTFRIALEEHRPRSSSDEDFKLQVAISAFYNDLVPPSTSQYLDFSVKQTTNGKIGKEDKGKIFNYRAQLEYTKTDGGAGMAVAIVRVPSCLTVNFDQLEKMRDNGDFDMYELRDDNAEIVLYWRQMTPEFSKRLDLQMQQTYKAQNCQQKLHTAYLYYEEEEIIICEVK